MDDLGLHPLMETLTQMWKTHGFVKNVILKWLRFQIYVSLITQGCIPCFFIEPVTSHHFPTGYASREKLENIVLLTIAIVIDVYIYITIVAP